MKNANLIRIARHQTSTFGGGVGTGEVSPFRVVSTTTPCREVIGTPGSADEEAIRYYCGCRKSEFQSAAQNAHADSVYARVLAGEVVTTMGGDYVLEYVSIA